MMDREEAIEKLNALALVQGGPDREEMIEAVSMAIEALSANAVQGVGRYENAMQKLRDMPRYLNGVKEKQITKISTNYTTEKPNGVVEQKNDVVAEPTDLISRADVLDIITFKRKLANIDGRILLDETVDRINALPSAEQVTSKLKNPCDSLLKADSESCKEQKSKLDLISRADAIEAVKEEIRFYEETTKDQQEEFDEGFICGMHRAKTRIRELPSADKPTELLDDGTLKVNVKSGAKVNRVLVWGDDGCGGLYYADDRPSGEWEDKEVFSETNDDHIVDEWQSARCSICGKYHTTPYMYYFEEYKYCPNCGAKMGGEAK